MCPDGRFMSPDTRTKWLQMAVILMFALVPMVQMVSADTTDKAASSGWLITPSTSRLTEWLITPGTSSSSDWLNTPRTSSSSDWLITPGTNSPSDWLITPRTSSSSDWLNTPRTSGLSVWTNTFSGAAPAGSQMSGPFPYVPGTGAGGSSQFSTIFA